jgi:hypothetical protein
MTPGVRRPPLVYRRDRITRALVAGVLLVLELPLLLPLIVGAGVMLLVMRVGALAQRLRRDRRRPVPRAPGA